MPAGLVREVAQRDHIAEATIIGTAIVRFSRAARRQCPSSLPILSLDPQRRQVALSDYTAAQVRAWAPDPRTAEWAHGEASDGRLVLVAANADDRPVAYIDLEPNGHIDRVFCAPEAAGQGIASRLYDAVEAAAREQGIRSLFTEASELARRLFERKGFAVAERQDLVICGVAIHNFRMAKALDLTAPNLT